MLYTISVGPICQYTPGITEQTASQQTSRRCKRAYTNVESTLYNAEGACAAAMPGSYIDTHGVEQSHGTETSAETRGESEERLLHGELLARQTGSVSRRAGVHGIRT